ncbi:hypothetical protein B0H34DRAFT_797398 [Crassisporium funariophilum]|nr:hypothetical protein B0H34DRAFT_797398 [Crassisporium funariophilum]
MTVFRISHRFRKGQMWFDDWIVVLPFAFDATYLANSWLSFYSPPSVVRYKVMPSFFFAIFLHFSVIWFSRISLSLSLARIFPPGHRARLLSFFLSALFLVFYLLTVILTTALCQGGGLPWYNINGRNCLTDSKGVAYSGIVSITADFLADSLLVLCPCMMLWRIRLPTNQRRLVLALFSASILTLMSVSLFCALWYGKIYMGVNEDVLRTTTSHLEATTSLIVSNLLVVTMFFYRIFRRVDNVESPEPVDEKSRPHLAPGGPAGGGPAGPGESTTTNKSSDASNVTPMTFTEISDACGYSSMYPSRMLMTFEIEALRTRSVFDGDRRVGETSTFQRHDT